MSISKTIETWRAVWTSQQRKHELGPTEDEDWEEYVNSLTTSEVLWNLTVYEEESD